MVAEAAALMRPFAGTRLILIAQLQMLLPLDSNIWFLVFCTRKAAATLRRPARLSVPLLWQCTRQQDPSGLHGLSFNTFQPFILRNTPTSHQLGKSELGMASGVMNEDVVIYYNDSIDSDNTAGALALALALVHRPNTRVLWILEPRQVSLGLSMSKEETARCLELIKEHPSSARGSPFKILLGGLLEEKDLASFECLDASDRELAS